MICFGSLHLKSMVKNAVHIEKARLYHVIKAGFYDLNFQRGRKAACLILALMKDSRRL